MPRIDFSFDMTRVMDNNDFIQFLDLIASLDLGYESESVTINPNPVTRLLEQSKTGHEHRCNGSASH